MIVNCPGCDAPHESIYSAGQHAWKSQDDDHSDYDDLDAALVAVMTHNDVVDSVDPVGDDAQEDSDDAGVDDLEDSPELSELDTPEQPTPNTPEQSAATDGGRQAPPMPDVDETDEQGDAGDVTVAELPDRYVPVENYVERKSRRDDIDGDALAAHLEDYDVVDVESFTGDSIEAYTIDEVIDDG